MIPNSDQSMAERLFTTAEMYPDMPALDYFGKQITYQHLQEKIQRLAMIWKNLGIEPGHRVIVCLPNIPEVVMTIYSLNMIGAVVCIVHPLSTAPEMSFYVQDTQSQWLITLDILYGNFRKAVEESDIKKTILTTVSGELPPIPRYLYYLKQGRKSPNYHGDRLIDWKTLIRNWLSPLKVFHHFSTDQPAVILFSGGTTGSPKGVLLSNQNMNALADQVLTRVNPQPGKDSTLCILPLFHGFGLGICLHSVLLGGGRCILIPRFSKKEFIDAIAKCKPTYIAGVPTHYEALINSEKLQKAQFSYLKGAFCGGDSVPLSLIKRFNDFMQSHGGIVSLREGYGLTECVTACSIMPEDIYKERSVGLPLPGNRFKIVRPQGIEEVPVGEVGEICINGPTVMLGYNNRPVETDRVLQKHKDGLIWLSTGDLGTLDQDGFLYFTGRMKRIIKCSGYAVYPSQVESVINSHPLVVESCVIGIPDEYTMSRVKAYVVIRGNVHSREKLAEEIKQSVAEQLIKWSVPTEITFLDSLPVTRMGKADYRALEAMERGEAII